jgi:O-Antigen ligase
VHRLLERFGGYLPPALALVLPVVYIPIPIASDSYVLPRAALVIVGACLGAGLAVLLPGRPGLGLLRLPLLAAAGAALLAFAFSTSWPLSLAGSYARYESLPIRLSYLGLLATAVWLLRAQRQRDWVVGGFVAGTSIACIKAWLQWIDHAPFRPDGDLGNANLLAALIVMAVPLAVDRVRRADQFAVAWGGAIVVLAAGLILTTSRSGFAGAGAGCLALLAFSVPQRWQKTVAAASAGAIGLGLVVLLATPLRTLNSDPPELRLHLWGDGLRMVASRPLTGYGEDTTGLNFGHFLSQDYATLVTFDRIHSGPLDIAATQGVLGLAALGWVLLVLFRGAWQRRSERGVGSLAAALVAYTVWVIPNFDWSPATGAFWLLAGTLWSSVSLPLPGGRVGERSPALIWRPAVALVLVAAAVVLAVFPVLAEIWYYRGRADLSVHYDPFQAQYHWALGLGLIAQGDLRGGTAELRRTADLGETEPGLYVELGDREKQLGDVAAARRDYQRALEIDPYYTPASQRLQPG